MAATRSVDWRKKALGLAARLPVARLHPRAVAAGQNCRGGWAVAFSGGSDSLALLLLLWAHWPERRRRLVALHFNHRLRGRASADDARFCATVCRALGVPFVSGTWSVPPAKVSEAAARQARLAFFDEALRRRRGPVLWLGHQMDDIAETMLMRLGRGSGTSGLAAPRPVQPIASGPMRLRPLLTLKKSELMDALQGGGIPWREDATNAGDRFLRNRLRTEVMAAWAGAHRDRDAFAGAALARERLEEDDDALEAWRQEVAPVAPDGTLDVRQLAGRPRGLVRRAVLAWLGAVSPAVDLARQATERLVDVVCDGTPTRFSLGREGFAVVRRGLLRFEPAKHP